jgi:hypothetical protein
MYKFYKGWNGFGINVLGKYDNGDESWISMTDHKKAWVVLFHGTK